VGFSPCGKAFESLHSLGGFYETAGIVKVFVFAFAFVFSLVAFLQLQLQLLLRLPFVRVLRIHLGLLYALDMSCCELGA
jgi:tetrahydromethanopterin S-methyltransferase subunit B